MLFNEKKYEFEIEGRKASFSTGTIARRSQAAVYATMGETVVLATVNISDPIQDGDFFPMSVEYIEKLYAAGMISSSRFVKRERFPTTDAILRARMIDRSFRSMFPSDYRNAMSITLTILSFDPQNDPLIIGMNAISAALLLSSAPFTVPISGVRVGLKDNKVIPVYQHVDRDDEKDVTEMNYVVSGDGKNFTMIDADSQEVTEEKIIEGMEYSLSLMNDWIKVQNEFVSIVGQPDNKGEYESTKPKDELINLIRNGYKDEIRANLDPEKYRQLDGVTLEKIFKEYEGKYTKTMMTEAYYKVAKQELQHMVLNEDKRADSRDFDEVRELDYKVGLLPRVHGSGLFTRGGTQALTTVTLGSIRSQQLVEDMTGEDERNYMHFYNALPFSTGEAGPVRYIPGRREVGHGSLAEKALLPVLPTKEEFPYTIVLISEIMSQEGSSSMGATCGSTLALMDAGVPIKKPVAGIAMGVVTNDDMTDFKILTDIMNLEDFYGEMDFKVAGTRDGVTAVQMDNKAAGLPLEVFKAALVKAKAARIKIIEGIESVISTPRNTLSKFAPKVKKLQIDKSRIGELIGPGGKVIRGITEETGAEINVEEDGSVFIFADNDESINAAFNIVNEIFFEPEIGHIYDAEVDTVVDFGAFVRFGPGMSCSGLVHVSELADGFVKNVRDIVNVGDSLKIKFIGKTDDGKYRLSAKAAK